MIVYHGSTEIIKSPDVVHSKRYLDFGRGFYLTSFQKQAEKWAKRKGLRKNQAAIVNVYELTDVLDEYKVLKFDNEDEKWLDFVSACRAGQDINNKYDIVIGNVADDDIFKTVDMYFRGIWDKERVLNELRYYKMNDQICIIKQEVISKVLIFKEAYEVK